MAEQSPAPTTSRSIYGFVIYLLFSSLFILYVLWAFIPHWLYEDYLGISELPNKYFALFVPILLLTATTFFAFFIYPSFSFIMTSDIDSDSTITDSHAIKRCQRRDSLEILCDNKIQKDLQSWETPSECDNHHNRESRVSNYCDCVDRKKCLLASDPSHIDSIRKPDKHMRNSADLDIYYVNQVLYGKKS